MFGGAMQDETTIKGKGGADVIEVSAAIAGSTARIEGNAGGDKITLSAGTAAPLSTSAPAPVTTPSLFPAFQPLLPLQGGGGADSISVTGVSASTNIVFGGAGADTIELNNTSGASALVGYGSSPNPPFHS